MSELARFAARPLGTRWLGHEQRHFSSVVSTNDEAARLAAAGAGHGMLVTTDEQTAGRGRQGRSWFSSAGQSLTWSLVLRPDVEPNAAAAIGLAVGLGVAEGLDTFLAPARKTAAVKWPNDVRVGGYKIAGVLVEMTVAGRSIERVIVGVGVNVNTRQFPDDLATPGSAPRAGQQALATSLALELGSDHDPADVLAAILPPLERWIDRYINEGPAPVVDAFTARADFIGHRVRVVLAGEEVHGEALGLDSDGALQLRLPSGEVKRVLAGDLHDPPS